MPGIDDADVTSKVEVQVERSLGVKSPYWSGGSFRIVLPRWFAKTYGRTRGSRAVSEDAGLEEVPFVFYSTDKGILVTPLSIALNDPVLGGILGVSDKLRGGERRVVRIPKSIAEELDRKLDLQVEQTRQD